MRNFIPKNDFPTRMRLGHGGGEVRYTENYTNDDVMNEIVTHGVDALIFIVYFYTLLVVPVRHITKHLFSAYSVGGV